MRGAIDEEIDEPLRGIGERCAWRDRMASSRNTTGSTSGRIVSPNARASAAPCAGPALGPHQLHAPRAPVVIETASPGWKPPLRSSRCCASHLVFRIRSVMGGANRRTRSQRVRYSGGSVQIAARSRGNLECRGVVDYRDAKRKASRMGVLLSRRTRRTNEQYGVVARPSRSEPGRRSGS